MSPRKQNLIVGAFGIVAVAVLVFGVYFLKETRPGQAVDAYDALFDQVSTLQEGDPVKVNGVKSGRVTSIRLDGRAVRVRFEVTRGVGLPVDSDLRIQNIGLMGERQLGIQLGQGADAAPGHAFRGGVDAGIAEAMGAAGEAVAEARALVRAVRVAVDSTVGHPEFAVRVTALLDAAESVAARMDRLAADLDPQVREGARALRDAGVRADALVRRQEPKVDRITDDAAAAAASARLLAERGARAAAGLEDLITRLNAGEGTAGALLTDTTLHRELSAAVRSADSLFRVMRRHGLRVNVDLF